jgi:hypothetical protein
MPDNESAAEAKAGENGSRKQKGDGGPAHEKPAEAKAGGRLGPVWWRRIVTGLGLFLIALTVFLAWLADKKQVATAAVDMVVRLLGALDARLLVGVVAAFLAARVWASIPLAPPGRVLGFTRHWGGLGSGEGGWEVDAHTIGWSLRAVAAVALSATAVLLLFRGLTSSESSSKPPASLELAPSASASSKPVSEASTCAACACCPPAIVSPPPCDPATPPAAPPTGSQPSPPQQSAPKKPNGPAAPSPSPT